MQTRQANKLQSLQAVQSFLDDHEVLHDVARSAARKRLDDLVAQLTTHVANQAGSNFASRGATKKLWALRRSLMRDHMLPIARIARADLPDSIEVQPLRMPRGNIGTEKLAAIAYGMAKCAQPFAAVFLVAGLPADFIARLTRATEAMLQASQERTRSRGRRGGATQGLATQLSVGRKVVHVIDALVQSAAANEPTILADWNIVKRVRRIGRATSGSRDLNLDHSLAVSPTIRSMPGHAAGL